MKRPVPPDMPLCLNEFYLNRQHSFGFLLHVHTAIDVQSRTCYVGGPGARQICHSLGNIGCRTQAPQENRSEEHTSELQSLMRISYAVFCLKKKKDIAEITHL